jgi:hypothetical protein
MTKNYLGVHLYIILSKNRINGAIIEMTVVPRSQTVALSLTCCPVPTVGLPINSRWNFELFTEYTAIFTELHRLVFPGCLTLLGPLSSSDPAKT